MAQPKIEVLGVYRLDITEEMLREQHSILYGYAKTPDLLSKTRRECRELLESAVLIEVLVSNRDKRFHAGDIHTFWGQHAYAEAYLAIDGESLLVERWADMPDVDPLRVAFCIYEWDANCSLLTVYGEVHCPAPQPMPERLKRLVPYEPID